MLCVRCGNQLKDGENVCSNCGYVNQNYVQQPNNVRKPNSKVAIIAIVIIVVCLCCCACPAGIFLTLLFKSDDIIDEYENAYYESSEIESSDIYDYDYDYDYDDYNDIEIMPDYSVDEDIEITPEYDTDDYEEYHYYGSDKIGYVQLQGDWFDFVDPDTIGLDEKGVEIEQYTKDSYIVTLGVMPGIDAIEAGEQTYKGMLEDETASDVVELVNVDDDTMSMHQTYTEFNNGTYWIVLYSTDKLTDKTLYISIETTYEEDDSDTFINKSFDIIGSYTPYK